MCITYILTGSLTERLTLPRGLRKQLVSALQIMPSPRDVDLGMRNGHRTNRAHPSTASACPALRPPLPTAPPVTRALECCLPHASSAPVTMHAPSFTQGDMADQRRVEASMAGMHAAREHAAAECKLEPGQEPEAAEWARRVQAAMARRHR